MTIKAISLKQPWANLIAEGRKTIETRAWCTRHRGPILIVSSKLPKISPAGCAVAVANLVDCRPMTAGDELAACCKLYPNARAWLLQDIRPIKPFAIKGSLGVFTVRIDKAKLDPFPLIKLFAQ